MVGRDRTNVEIKSILSYYHRKFTKLSAFNDYTNLYISEYLYRQLYLG